MLELTKMTQKRRVKKVIFPSLRFLFCFLFCFLLCTPSFALENSSEILDKEAVMGKQASVIEYTTEALQKMQVLLGDHLDEWNEMKPALKRLIKSEQDLTLIIAALDKMSPLAAQPSEKQLLEKTTLTLPQKTEKKKASVVAKKTEKKKPSVVVKKTGAKVAAIKKPKKQQAVKSDKHFAIHLASYKKAENALRGWSVLEHKYSGILKNKKPLSQKVTINNKLYIRLLAGNFESREAVQQACRTLKNTKQYCHIVTY